MSRACGDCAACCHVPPIPEVEKPACTNCRHLRTTVQEIGRCGVYATRPDRCASYRCLWLDAPDVLPEGSRPDRLGVIFDVQQLAGGGQVVRAMEMHRGAATAGPGWRLVQALALFGSVSVIRYGEPDTALVVRPDGRGGVCVTHRPAVRP